MCLIPVVGRSCSSLPCLKTGVVVWANSVRIVLPQRRSVLDSLTDRPEIY